MGGFTKVRFAELMSDLFELMGWRWSDKRMVRIHDEFMIGYELWDLKGAIKRMETEEHFKYGKFKNHMDMVRAERLEKEAFNERLQEERVIQGMLHGQEDVECINHGQCDKCSRTHCPILDKDCLAAVNAIYEGKIGVDEAHKILAKRYKGLGFDKEVSQDGMLR
jgi:hypothetical protein